MSYGQDLSAEAGVVSLSKWHGPGLVDEQRSAAQRSAASSMWRSIEGGPPRLVTCGTSRVCLCAQHGLTHGHTVAVHTGPKCVCSYTGPSRGRWARAECRARGWGPWGMRTGTGMEEACSLQHYRSATPDQPDRADRWPWRRIAGEQGARADWPHGGSTVK